MLSFAEIDDRINGCHKKARKAIAFVAIGCTEQHGPFLPIQTDTLISENVSLHLAEAINDEFWGYVLPSISYAPTKSNANYSGTFSVDEEPFRQYVKQICKSILNSHFDALALISGHAPANPSLNELSFNLVLEQYNRKDTVKKPVLMISLLECKSILEQKFGQRIGLHADWRELLYLVYILGNKYFDDKRTNDIMDFQRNNSFPLINSPVLGIPMELRSVQGIIGDPTPNSKEDWGVLARIAWDETISHLTALLKQKLNVFWEKEGFAC